MYQIISIEYKIPRGKYCWAGNVICDKFENEGGWQRCKLFSYTTLHSDGLSYLKLSECKNAKLIKK